MAPARRRTLLFALVSCGAAGTATATFGGDGGSGPAPAPAAAPSPANPVLRPRIVFDRTAHDFGAVKQKSDATTRFTVKNAGTAPLEIASLKGDCGCANATVSKSTLAPGESATVDVVFSTHTFFGPQKKTIHVRSNDPEARETELVLSLDVSGGIVLQPAYFACETVLVGTSPTATVRAQWKEGTGRKFAVRSVESPDLRDAVFRATPFDAPPWHGYDLVLTFAKPPALGTFLGRAVIRTDDPENPMLVADVSGSVSGRVVLSQRVVTFGQVRQGQGGVRRVLCRPFDATVTLGEVTAASTVGVVTADAHADEKDPTRYVIDIRLPESTPSGGIVDFVDVRTKVPGEERLQIKVVGTVLPAAK
jgi:hypothetical protein